MARFPRPHEDAGARSTRKKMLIVTLVLICSYAAEQIRRGSWTLNWLFLARGATNRQNGIGHGSNNNNIWTHWLNRTNSKPITLALALLIVCWLARRRLRVVARIVFEQLTAVAFTGATLGYVFKGDPGTSSTPTLESLEEELAHLPPLEPCFVASTYETCKSPSSSSLSSASSRSSTACDTDGFSEQSGPTRSKSKSKRGRTVDKKKTTANVCNGSKTTGNRTSIKEHTAVPSENLKLKSCAKNADSAMPILQEERQPQRVLLALAQISTDSTKYIRPNANNCSNKNLSNKNLSNKNLNAVGADGNMQPPVSLQVLEDEASVAAEANRMPSHAIVFDTVLGVVSKQVRDQLSASPAFGPSSAGSGRASFCAGMEPILPSVLLLEENSVCVD